MTNTKEDFPAFVLGMSCLQYYLQHPTMTFCRCARPICEDAVKGRKLDGEHSLANLCQSLLLRMYIHMMCEINVLFNELVPVDKTKKISESERNLLSAIRNVIAHGGQEKFEFDWGGNFKFNIHEKKNQQLIELDIKSMHEMIDRIAHENNFKTCYFALREDALRNAILSKQLSINNIQNFVDYYNKDGKRVKLDEFQKETLYNIFSNYYDYRSCGFDICNSENLQLYFPYISSPISNLKMKITTAAFIRHLLGDEKQINIKKDYIENISSFRRQNGFVPIYSSPFIFSIFTSCMFEIMISNTRDEIQSQSRDPMDPMLQTKLRNAIIHGKYFFNHSNTLTDAKIYFYDHGKRGIDTCIAEIPIASCPELFSNWLNIDIFHLSKESTQG